MTGLRDYAPHKLDAVPPCDPDMFAHNAYVAYMGWLHKWFPNADVVDVHRSKGVLIPIVRVAAGEGSVAYIGYNFQDLVICMGKAPWREAEGDPRVAQRMKRIRRREARRPSRGRGSWRIPRLAAGQSEGQSHCSLQWKAGPGEVLVTTYPGVVETLVEMGVLGAAVRSAPPREKPPETGPADAPPGVVDWTRPVPMAVTDADIAFGGGLNVVERLMPPRELIPAEFDWRLDTWAHRVFRDLFFRSKCDVALQPKPGIDPTKAARHIRAIMGSFQPSQEHKTSACAYLFASWFEEPSGVTSHGV